MKRLIITLEDEQFNLLKKKSNMSQTVRDSLDLYLSDITPDTIDGLRAAFSTLAKLTKEIDSKLDYLAGRLDD